MTKRYKDEFKAEAVARFLKLKSEGNPIRHIEKVIGVPNSLLYSWAAKAKSKQLPHKGIAEPVEPTTNLPPPTKDARGHFDPRLREEGLKMLAAGARIIDVAKRTAVPVATVAYWKKASQTTGKLPVSVDAAPQIMKPANGIGSGGAITDALIYLRHAEKEILDMVRDGKIMRPDQAHLLTLLALGCLQKSIAK